MNNLSDKMQAFAQARIGYIKRLKQQSEQQKMLLSLAEQYFSDDALTAAEFRALKTLLAAEKASEEAAEATRRARRLVSTQNEKKRKERTHHMIQAAGLLALAGLLDKETGKPTLDNATLLGAFAHIAKANELQRESWKSSGARMLDD